MVWQDVTRSSLCSGVKECGSKRAHNFLFPKSSFRSEDLKTWWCSKILLSFLVRFDGHCLTKTATAAMFTSVRADFGWPPLSSSSASSLPSRNREYHLKRFDRFRASFPSVFCANTSVSVADRPALKQNFMASLCSFPPSMMYKKTDFTNQVITCTLLKIHKRNSGYERMLVDST